MIMSKQQLQTGSIAGKMRGIIILPMNDLESEWMTVLEMRLPESPGIYKLLSEI